MDEETPVLEQGGQRRANHECYSRIVLVTNYKNSAPVKQILHVVRQVNSAAKEATARDAPGEVTEAEGGEGGLELWPLFLWSSLFAPSQLCGGPAIFDGLLLVILGAIDVTMLEPPIVVPALHVVSSRDCDNMKSFFFLTATHGHVVGTTPHIPCRASTAPTKFICQCRAGWSGNNRIKTHLRGSLQLRD